MSYGGTEGRLLKACYCKLFRRHRDLLCGDRKREGGGGWGSYLKWDLQISTQHIMGSCGWRGHWGAVDFPSWDRDIITLRVATQKSPSSVPRLVSANYKHSEWPLHMKRKPLLFFFFFCIIWVQSHSRLYNFCAGALLSSTDYYWWSTTLLRITRLCVWYFVHYGTIQRLWGRLEARCVIKYTWN